MPRGADPSDGCARGPRSHARYPFGLVAAGSSGARLLDAGCGTGALSVEAALRGADVVGVDISPSLVDIARVRGAEVAPEGKLTFLSGDMLDPSLGEFDYVVAMDSLIHYDCGDVVGSLAQLGARTRQGMLFTFAPWTPLLGLAHSAGRFFPEAIGPRPSSPWPNRACAVSFPLIQSCAVANSGLPTDFPRFLHFSGDGTHCQSYAAALLAMTARGARLFSSVLNRLGPGWLPFADAASATLPLGRLLRLSLFQFSVGMALVLLNGTLNRVMIVELSVPAWLVATMVSVPLLIAPLRALIGHRSDSYRSVLGWRRVPFLGLGTMLQYAGLGMMPFALLVL